MKAVKYGNGEYNAESICRKSREEFVSGNKTFFNGMPEDKRAVKLGELWDTCKAALPAEEAALPAKKAGRKAEKEAETVL